MTRLEIRRHLFATGAMVVGSGLVFGLVLAMNSFSEPPEKAKAEAVTAFQVEKEKPQPKNRPDQRPKRERKPTRSDTARAPMPQLSAQISGVSFGLPAFEGDFSRLAGDSLLGDAAKELVMTEDAVDQPAQPVQRVPAQYPSSARQKGIEGHVALNILVAADGSVKRVQVLGAEPPGVFDDAARSAVQQWEFKPGVYQGSPTTMWLKQVVRFKLQ
jgi:protein TonB